MIDMKESGFKVYGQENILRNDFDYGKRFVDQKKFDELRKYEIIPNDIIITTMGSGTPGKACVVPDGIQRGIMDSHIVRVRINPRECNYAYLSFVIKWASYFKHQIRMAFRGATMTGLNSSVVRSLSLCIPDISEQQQIVTNVENTINRMESVISKIKQQIEKLQEYRQSQISAAVTGKIDVRQQKEAAISE